MSLQFLVPDFFFLVSRDRDFHFVPTGLYRSAGNSDYQLIGLLFIPLCDRILRGLANIFTVGNYATETFNLLEVSLSIRWDPKNLLLRSISGTIHWPHPGSLAPSSFSAISHWSPTTDCWLMTANCPLPLATCPYRSYIDPISLLYPGSFYEILN